jgi:ribonuclease BN (tRNA processing enzyme)
MDVLCLGSGDAFSSKGKLNTSFYFRTGGKGILLDCGATTLAALKKNNLSSSDVDVILLSHLHGDHFAGVPFILTERQVKGNRDHPLVIIGPKETESIINKTVRLMFPGIGENLWFPVSYIVYRIGEPLKHHDDFTLTVFEAVHAPVTKPHSLRIETKEKIIAYSGDTQWNENLIEVSRDADLFICEGYAYNNPEDHHMDIKELLNYREQITAKKIVLTHMSEEALDSAGLIPLQIAEDGVAITI